MSATTYRLRTDPNQKVDPPWVTLLDLFSGVGGSTIQLGHEFLRGVALPPLALDLFNFASAAYCADRKTPRPDSWAREISVELNVNQPSAWTPVADDMARSLSFLSGDAWRLDVIPTPAGTVSSTVEPPKPVDVVCLFSGGLDSFAGAVDLLAKGNRVCLLGHHEGGQASQAQERLLAILKDRFGEDQVTLRRLFLRPAPPNAAQFRHLPTHRESSTRSRSLLFIAAGLAIANAYGPGIPLHVPENGFIGINVPLTAARSGSFSTRTTHPYFIETFGNCVAALGIENPIVNPFRLKTKGEILTATADTETITRFARDTLSCAHPEAPRWVHREQGNCGYCFPCLIRRSALHRLGLDDAVDYSFDALHEESELTELRGSDVRCLVRSLNATSRPTDVLRNGPVPGPEVRAFFDVYERGRIEILEWMRAASPKSWVSPLLPAR